MPQKESSFFTAIQDKEAKLTKRKKCTLLFLSLHHLHKNFSNQDFRFVWLFTKHSNVQTFENNLNILEVTAVPKSAGNLLSALRSSRAHRRRGDVRGVHGAAWCWVRGSLWLTLSDLVLDLGALRIARWRELKIKKSKINGLFFSKLWPKFLKYVASLSFEYGRGTY